jgi:plasmid stabilization system protein ParE
MYAIEFAEAARRDIANIAQWYAPRNPVLAAKLANDLRVIADRDIGRNPERYAYFWLTGGPYRGRLYTVSRRSSGSFFEFMPLSAALMSCGFGMRPATLPPLKSETSP